MEANNVLFCLPVQNVTKCKEKIVFNIYEALLLDILQSICSVTQLCSTACCETWSARLSYITVAGGIPPEETDC